MMGKLICSDEMNISRYREWAIRNYGDSGKTKTVTKRKYERIMKVLRGKERYAGSASSENGKFRFWVRGKGFKLGKPLGYPVVGVGDEVLLVPVKTTTADGTILDKGYKQVAVVEDFYDIIYNVHVQTEGKEGKHAGQKRTYRAVAEKFAFLPREAVTRFLMSCKDCKTRMQLTFESSDKPKEKTIETENREPENEVPDIRYSLPITTTYLSHLRNLQYMSENEAILQQSRHAGYDSSRTSLRRIMRVLAHECMMKEAMDIVRQLNHVDCILPLRDEITEGTCGVLAA